MMDLIHVIYISFLVILSLRLVLFCIDKIFDFLSEKLNLSANEDDVDILRGIFPNFNSSYCKDALEKNDNSYERAYAYLIEQNNKLKSKSLISKFNEPRGDSPVKRSRDPSTDELGNYQKPIIYKGESKIDRINRIKELLDTLKRPSELRDKSSSIKKEIKAKLIKEESIIVKCICGCDGMPMGVAKGPIDYSTYKYCPARILRKEKEKFYRAKSRKELSLKNRIKKDAELALIRRKEKREKLKKKKEEWIERRDKKLSPITREEGKWRKAKTFLGNPCKKGHGGERYTKSGQCVTCRDYDKRLRDAMKRGAYPVNLSQEEKDQVVSIYKKAQKMTRESNVEYHVDHIRPLSKGGIHHPSNLQILTAEENLKKGANYKNTNNSKDT